MVRLLAFLALAASYVVANEQNLCRVTDNYGCTSRGINCNDVFGSNDLVPSFVIPVFSSCPGRTKSADSTVCCTTSNLNGGYCPNFSELQRYGFQRVGFGARQMIAPNPLGPARVKCNKRGGPHFCKNVIRAGGANRCLDQGLYD